MTKKDSEPEVVPRSVVTEEMFDVPMFLSE